MLFTDDILTDVSSNEINLKLEFGRQPLESRDFKLSRTKILFIYNNFSNIKE